MEKMFPTDVVYIIPNSFSEERFIEQVLIKFKDFPTIEILVDIPIAEANAISQNKTPKELRAKRIIYKFNLNQFSRSQIVNKIFNEIILIYQHPPNAFIPISGSILNLIGISIVLDKIQIEEVWGNNPFVSLIPNPTKQFNLDIGHRMKNKIIVNVDKDLVEECSDEELRKIGLMALTSNLSFTDLHFNPVIQKIISRIDNKDLGLDS